MHYNSFRSKIITIPRERSTGFLKFIYLELEIQNPFPLVIFKFKI
jgi:hypothetical protein